MDRGFSIWCLTGSVALLVMGILFRCEWLLAFGGISLIACLAALGGAPRVLVALFLFLTGAAMLSILLDSGGQSSGTGLLGIPSPALWMLGGIWLGLILIWPLGFLIWFRRWIDR